jgi:hypothetical protein
MANVELQASRRDPYLQLIRPFALVGRRRPGPTFAAAVKRRRATIAHTASTTPNGHVPDRKP